jgi:hypothetical protein
MSQLYRLHMRSRDISSEESEGNGGGGCHEAGCSDRHFAIHATRGAAGRGDRRAGAVDHEGSGCGRGRRQDAKGPKQAGRDVDRMRAGSLANLQLSPLSRSDVFMHSPRKHGRLHAIRRQS